MSTKTEMKKPKQDPVKDATYNPKEFRVRRSVVSAPYEPSRGRRPDVAAPYDPTSSGPGWRSILLLAVIFMIGWYLSNKHLIPATFTTLPTIPLPATGDVQRLRPEPPGTAYAPLKLFGNRHGKHCIFRLEDWQTGATVLAVFVRSGDVTEASVPFGQYRVKIVCGSTWDGAQFGPATTINQLVSPVFMRKEAGGWMIGG